MTTKTHLKTKTTIFSKKTLENNLRMFERLPAEKTQDRVLLKAYRQKDNPDLVFYGQFQTEGSSHLQGIVTTAACETYPKPVASLLFKDRVIFGQNADDIMEWTEVYNTVDDLEKELGIKVEPLTP